MMQIRNNYDIVWHRGDDSTGTGVFNGDIGVLCELDHFNEIAIVRFDDDREAEFAYSSLEELEHAYAVTVHKSQGSEYPVVIFAAGSFMPRLCTRELLYTALTRAKKMVIIVGSEHILQEMVDNNLRPTRYTGLCEWISGYEKVM